MREYQVAVIVGSLRQGSINRQFAQAMARMVPAHVKFHMVDLSQLPLYNSDDDGKEVPSTLQFRDAVRPADAVLFVTPEYNRSIPGVLKNALDQGSRPYGQSVWEGKPAAVIGVTPGATGTAMAQQHLRNVLSYFNMPTMMQPEAYIQAGDDFFTADGQMNERSQRFVQKFVDQFVAWIAKHQA